MNLENKISRMFMDVIPPAMHLLRQELRKNRIEDLTVPQFRILASVNRGLDCVGKIAAHQGVSQPAMSRMVDALHSKGYLERKESPDDRRFHILSLTDKGKMTLEKIKKEALRNLEQKMKGNSKEELNDLYNSLLCLEQFLFKMKDVAQ